MEELGLEGVEKFIQKHDVRDANMAAGGVIYIGGNSQYFAR